MGMNPTGDACTVRDIAEQLSERLAGTWLCGGLRLARVRSGIRPVLMGQHEVVPSDLDPDPGDDGFKLRQLC